MRYRWTIAPAQPLLVSKIASQLGVSPLLAQCLINRGLSDISEARKFLKPRLQDISDPFLLPNMSKAVERLLQAYDLEEPVVVFGDYDVDGVTSTVLIYDLLKRLGWNIYYYLPNRMEEGYGLSEDGVANCLHRYPTKLILAVDCGSSASKVISLLKQQEIDVIVLDHHQISSPPPPAIALVNPMLNWGMRAEQTEFEANPALPETYPSTSIKTDFRELCSVGITFKLAHALLKRARELNMEGAHSIDLKIYLDLVALGTIADMVPLSGENRILVSAGLKRINESPRHGLSTLIEVADIKPPVGVYEVGFMLAPRLNAAGRLENAEEAFQLLIAESKEEALPLAQRLDAKNRERQSIERTIIEEVTQIISAKFDPQKDYVIVEGSPKWHIGVVGIVASRVLQQFHRPTIIMGGDGEHLRGSGRSIDGLDLASALRMCSDLLLKHGGHAMAAGLTIAPENLDKFRAKLNEIVRSILSPEDLLPSLHIDSVVKLNQLSLNAVKELQKLEPIGHCNPQALFCAANLTHYRPLARVGADRQHVKMWVTDGTAVCEAIWWNGGNCELPTGSFDLAFVPQTNDYYHEESVQLRVIDWRKSDTIT